MRSRDLTRRTFLGAAAAGGLLAATGCAPALVRDRPVLTHGVQAGDPLPGSVLVWTRADRPSRMVVEVARDESFRQVTTVQGPLLTPGTDLTGSVRVPTGDGELHYRVLAEDLDGRAVSAPLTGRFRVPGAGPLRIQWGGDVVGQGFGINPDLGGLTIFSAMADREPDVFVHSGDTVYADGPLTETVALPGGRTWRNVVSPAKSTVAETLAEYRGQYAYTLTDEHYRRFTASVAQVNQWDDHEVVNNWYPGEILADDRYTEKRVDVLAARAAQAYHEWVPLDRHATVDGRVYRRIPLGPHVEVFVLDMRSYRDPDGPGAGSVLGQAQAEWLVAALTSSSARWKLVAADMPLGLSIPDGPGAWDGVGNGDPGRPLGREAEIAGVLAAMRRNRVGGVVWLTAEVHYAAAHHYSPERAGFTDFDPFWEFVSGPLHAGPFAPTPLDPTFGPEQVFVSAPSAAGASPLDGFQHFGEIEVPPDGESLRVSLRGQQGQELWSTTL